MPRKTLRKHVKVQKIYSKSHSFMFDLASIGIMYSPQKPLVIKVFVSRQSACRDDDDLPAGDVVPDHLDDPVAGNVGKVLVSKVLQGERKPTN